MESIDRLGWTAGVAVEAYGTTVGVRVNDASILPQVAVTLPPAWQPASSSRVESLFSLRVAPPSSRTGRRNYHLVYAGAARVARTTDLAEALETLENYLRVVVAYWADEDKLFVHAGVVGWRDRAILLPGRSFTGKTTLVAALIRAGATYYSDDMAILDAKGRVHPYPVALSVRGQGGRQKLLADQLGGAIGRTPLPVGAVVATEYAPGARWRPRAVSPGRAMLALFDNTVAARRNPAVSLPILRTIAENAAAIKGKRGEADDTARLLLRYLSKLSQFNLA